MDKQLLIIVLLTFIIHLIGTLAYSVRIAGTRTGKIALSLSIFNDFRWLLAHTAQFLSWS